MWIYQEVESYMTTQDGDRPRLLWYVVVIIYYVIKCACSLKVIKTKQKSREM